MLKETEQLLTIFSIEEKKEIIEIVEGINSSKENYKTVKLWEFDQKLGGIGGYCQGCDPAKSNSFQGTEVRNVYRALQYVRSDIDLCNIHDVARYAVQSCGLHLEEVLKLYAKRESPILGITCRNQPLGKLVHTFERKNIIDLELINKLKFFVPIYNVSKHEIRSDDEIDRTFHADDAIICYFACRKIGIKLLLLIEDEYAFKTYEICWDKFDRKIDRF